MVPKISSDAEINVGEAVQTILLGMYILQLSEDAKVRALGIASPIPQ